MKRILSARLSVLGSRCLGVCLVGWMLSAQAQAELDIQTHAVLRISGKVGTVYAVEFATDLAESNSPTAWQCLEFLALPASPYLWTDTSAPLTTKRFYRAREFPPPTNMVFILPGTFRMGSPTNEADRQTREGPQTSVILSRGFWIGKYEVTQREFVSVYGNNLSRFNGGAYGVDLNRPAERMTWEEAVDYCTGLTRREQAAGRIPLGSEYRLPTEAEWEYACRGWTSTRFSYGNDSGYTQLGSYAWYQANGGEITHAVGHKLPNPWGLYDMEGNVMEWCQDWWSDHLPGGVVLDPQGPTSGPGHVYRGGAWHFTADRCRSAYRDDGVVVIDRGVLGLRVVLAAARL